MKLKWNNITKDNVLEAIKVFNTLNEKYPEPKNTFLLYNDKKYPAKHIRGLAYKICNNIEISKNDYSGGLETSNFFKKLGFTIEYKRGILTPKNIHSENKNIKLNIVFTESPQEGVKKQKIKKLNVVSQKNALQRLLQKHFGHIETEKKFIWLKTPDHEKLPDEYIHIVKKLSSYRNQVDFKKSNRSLLCDIVLEDLKLIIEYDENQHFTFSRKLTLENYPEDIKVSFSKQDWITSCERINAKDNNPIDRDEKRAYYDAVRDIEAHKNNYKLVRIKHGDVDWENDKALNDLKLLIGMIDNNSSIIDTKLHKIARIIVTGKQYYSQYYTEKTGEPKIENLSKILNKFVKNTYNKQHFEFILTPGGFLTFKLPEKYNSLFDITHTEKNEIQYLQEIANIKINEFFLQLNANTFQKLQAIADYFTIGIDGFNDSRINSIELVAVYDLKKQMVIHWTGKFYPTEFQKKHLIKINDLDTHFITLNSQNIVLLGCHDLNVYNPRGQANANAESWKRSTADEFKKRCKDFQPDIVLQHPHTTDTPNIWNLAWITLEKELLSVKHFASGIKYDHIDDVRERNITKVLEKTKKGDVTDFFYNL